MDWQKKRGCRIPLFPLLPVCIPVRKWDWVAIKVPAITGEGINAGRAVYPSPKRKKLVNAKDFILRHQAVGSITIGEYGSSRT